MPPQAAQNASASLIAQEGGTTELTLASGAITQTWEADVLRLIDTIDHLSDWQVLADTDRIQITGFTYDKAERHSLIATLDQQEMIGACEAVSSKSI